MLGPAGRAKSRNTGSSGGKLCDRTDAAFNDRRFDRDEIWFLKALRAAGERGRIISALASQAGLVRLVEVQYVTRRPQSERKTLYVITHRGRQALANAPHAIDERDRRIN